MKSIVPVLLLGAALMTGCASVSPESKRDLIAESQGEDAARLLIFRQQSLQASLADAYIGADDKGYFVQLGQNQYTELNVPPGVHKMQVKAHASVSQTVSVVLKPGDTQCMEARPNHENLHLLAIPFLNAMVPSFVLEETACPTQTALAGTKKSVNGCEFKAPVSALALHFR